MADLSGQFAPENYNRVLAALLMKQGLDASPIQSWTQGAARLAQALVGARYRDLDRQQQAEATASLAGLLRNNPQATGSIAPSANQSIPPSVFNPTQLAQNDTGGLSGGTLPTSGLADAIKGFEGFSPVAQPDYKQNSFGYGSKADYAGQPIDRATAEAKLATDLNNAGGIVNSFAPNAPQPVKDALTSLTQNSGSAWTTSGLGQAVKAGDWTTAANILEQYNKAGGQVLPGLVDRRAQEASWIRNNQGPGGGLGDLLGPSSANAAPLQQPGVGSPNDRVAQAFSALPPTAEAPPAPTGGFQGTPAQNYTTLSVRPNVPQAATPTASQAAPQSDIKTRIAAMLSSPNPYVQNMGQQLASNLIGQQITPPVFHTITDSMGNQVPVLVDVNTGTMKRLQVSGTGQGAGGVGDMQTIDQTKAVYPQLNKGQQGVVDAMLSGRMAMPSAFALKQPYWQTMIGAANEQAQATGGKFDATDWAQRNRTATDFGTGGKSGQTINALDTVQKHIEKLSNDIEKLDNGGWTYWNYLRNGVATNTPIDPTRRKQTQAVEDDLKAVNNEMARAYRSGTMSDKEVKDWQSLLSASSAKETSTQALSDFLDLLNSKREALTGQYRQVMGKNPTGPNNAENERITKIVKDRNAGVGQQSEPSGWGIQRIQ